jgi:hypothetical protein
VPIVTHNGTKVLECFCGDGIWGIEHCPSKSNTHYSVLQKYTKHYCNAKTISKQTDCGIFVPCYVGYWSTTKGVLIELHKFWFCHDDLNRCVGRISRKYDLDNLTLPSLWFVQVGTYLTQIKVVALEDVGFLLSKKPRCPLINYVGDDRYAPVNKAWACAPHNLFGDGIFAHVYKALDPNA